MRVRTVLYLLLEYYLSCTFNLLLLESTVRTSFVVCKVFGLRACTHLEIQNQKVRVSGMRLGGEQLILLRSYSPLE